ncbi:MAG: tetratricopeptide repeat protein [Bacteroidota bacterium]
MNSENNRTVAPGKSGEDPLIDIDSLNEESWSLRYKDQVASETKAMTALSMAREINYFRGQAYACLNLAAGHFLKSSNKDALELLADALGYFNSHTDEPGYAAVLNYTGNIYESFGDYETALDYCLRAYNTAVQIGNNEMVGEVQSVLGLIYSRMSDYDRALKAHKESLRIREEKGDQMAAASSLNRIARIHTLTREYDKALEYYNRSLSIREKLGQKGLLAWTYLGLASTYEAMEMYEEARDYYRKMLKGEHQCLDDRCRMQATLGLGRTLHKLNLEEEALSCFENSLALAIQLEAKPLQVESHSALADFYESSGQFEKALYHYKAYRSTREAVMDDETRNRLKNQQIAFAVEKSEKEKEIFQLRNVELKSAYDEIHHKNKEITDSINYASRIQGALLPQNANLKGMFPDHFIIFLPKDMVSGDFYWATEVGKQMVFAAADCTGHGVPGALMSMLGISFLNEVVIERGQTNPGEILDNLRDEVIKALKQSGKADEQKDGMDIALCTYDSESGVIKFAGAYNPLYLVREGSLEEYKADRMPISYYHGVQDSFKTTSIKVQKGDALYLFSDGFADQFGGPHRKKFKYKPLKELLELIHEKSMQKQKLVLYEKFLDWKGVYDQIDDVVMIGIRI